MLRVVGDGDWVEAEALVPPSADIATTTWPGRALDELRQGLFRIGRVVNATAAYRGYLLEGSLETAAIPLLDPDTLVRQARTRA